MTFLSHATYGEPYKCISGITECSLNMFILRLPHLASVPYVDTSSDTGRGAKKHRLVLLLVMSMLKSIVAGNTLITLIL